MYKYQPFSTYFLDCKSSEVEAAVKYIEKRFRALNINAERNIYCYAVNLTDFECMGRVLIEIE